MVSWKQTGGTVAENDIQSATAKEWNLAMTHSPATSHLLGKQWAWLVWVNVLLGAWEIAAPWIWGYAGLSPAALWNDIITGGLIFLVGLWAVWARMSWPAWWNVFFGVWLIAAPFLLDYGFVLPRSKANDVIVGILVVIFAVFTALLRPGWYSTTRPAR